MAHPVHAHNTSLMLNHENYTYNFMLTENSETTLMKVFPKIKRKVSEDFMPGLAERNREKLRKFIDR